MRVIIDVWSDYVCPFCYLEVPVLARLQETHGDALEVRWHAYELRPDPVPTLDPAGDYLTRTWARAVYPMAAERGMTLRLPPVQPRSRLAHEAMQQAIAEGAGAAMNVAIFAAFFEHGRDIGDPAVLVEIGKDLGIGSIDSSLREGRHRKTVLEDEKQAAELGITGVPFMILRRGNDPLGHGRAISGAEGFDSLHRQIERIGQFHPSDR